MNCQFVSQSIHSNRCFIANPFEMNLIYIYLTIIKRQQKRDLKTIFQYLMLRSVERSSDGNTSALAVRDPIAQCLPLNLIIANMRQIKAFFINGLIACLVSHVH